MCVWQWSGASRILLQGRTVNKEYYLEVMSRLLEAIRQKRIELWKNQSYGVFFSTKECALYFKKCNIVFVS